MLEKKPKRKIKKENEMKRKTVWKEEKQKKKTKVELVPYTAKNDPWSDHLETQFGPTYPFFQNPEPRPTLRT